MDFRETPVTRVPAITIGVAAITCCLVFEGCAFRELPRNIDACLSAEYGDALARTDAANHRAFLVWKAVPERDGITALVTRARHCMTADTGWAESYSISVFSHARFAGYMTEAHIMPLVESGDWDSAYLAEYDHAARQLTLMPLIAPEEVALDR
ncbi:MAG: hypothetical protein KUG77_00775 [Nannocystaceae bacterium]|nr:hypothetical protein [Nannocystaceae bacterium]